MALNVLLADQQFRHLVPSREPDAHGWAQEGEPTDKGLIRGCLTRNTPLTDNSATGEGEGPFAPKFEERATAYLEKAVEPGDILLDDEGGERWYLDNPRLVKDHTGAGLDCWVADAWFLVSEDV